MRVVVVASVVIAACSSQHTSQPDAPTSPDALACTAAAADTRDCRPGGLASLDIDGMWHMVGSETFTMSGSASTTPIDYPVFIHRDGCSAGFSSTNATPPDDPTMSADDTAIVRLCAGGAECSHGQGYWSICLRDSDGVVRWLEHDDGYSTGVQFQRDGLATLTR